MCSNRVSESQGDDRTELGPLVVTLNYSKCVCVHRVGCCGLTTTGVSLFVLDAI